MLALVIADQGLVDDAEENRRFIGRELIGIERAPPIAHRDPERVIGLARVGRSGKAQDRAKTENNPPQLHHRLLTTAYSSKESFGQKRLARKPRHGSLVTSMSHPVTGRHAIAGIGEFLIEIETLPTETSWPETAGNPCLLGTKRRNRAVATTRATPRRRCLTAARQPSFRRTSRRMAATRSRGIFRSHRRRAPMRCAMRATRQRTARRS